MKNLLGIIAGLLMVLSAGCATVEVESPDGFVFKSSTLWKDISGAEVQTADFVGSINSSKSVEDAKAMMAVCLLFPENPACSE